MTRASRWIRAGGILASGDCRVSHASLALGDQARQPEVIESLWRVTRTPWENYRGQELVVWRHRWLSTGDRKEIVNAALGEIDQAYGGLKLLLFGLDTLCGTSWFTRRLGISHLKVCSNLIAWSYDRGVPFLGPWFGQPWRSVSPDTIDDWCRCHTEDWIEVYSSINGHARKAA
jgi:hypothetical protein